MGLLMKSQEKMTPERLLLLKKHLAFFVSGVRKSHGKTPSFGRYILEQVTEKLRDPDQAHGRDHSRCPCQPLSLQVITRM
jgi:hypothetical protein